MPAPALPSVPGAEADARLKRVFEAAECRTQVELAEFLHIRQSSISDAKRRGSIPAEWLLKLLLLKGISPQWVLSGEGGRFMQSTEAPVACMPAQSCHPGMFSTEMLLRELLRRAVRKTPPEKVCLSR